MGRSAGFPGSPGAVILDPHLAQNLAPSGLSAPQEVQKGMDFSLVGSWKSRGQP
jgi:hypothetical protein